MEKYKYAKAQYSEIDIILKYLVTHDHSLVILD